MKQPTIEFNVETDTCPRCRGHAFERVRIKKKQYWKCLSCKQIIDEVR